MSMHKQYAYIVRFSHSDRGPLGTFSRLLQVVPSVKGLDLKALKSMLKKESCYTTILTTARIRGTEKINIVDETVGSNSRVYYVHF